MYIRFPENARPAYHWRMERADTMRFADPPGRCRGRTRRFAAAAALASIAACSSDGAWYTLGGPKTSTGASAGFVANLRGLGSAVSGKVSVIDRGDGVTLLVSAVNLPPGGYSIAFHANGNCSSPNGYSAGPIIWPPPGARERTIPMFTNSLEGNAESQTHVSGIRTGGENGLAGRSVIIYGGLISDAQPGVPNNRYACGVFEPASTLF
jgi:Cu/Zn superoxide dismutase